MSSTDESIVIPVNGYANVTLDYYLPEWSLALSITNAALFLIFYSIYLVALGIFLKKFAQQTSIKRNHKVLFVFSVLSVIIQSLNLLIRIIYDGMHLEARAIAERGELVRWDYYVVLQTMGGLSAFFMYINFVGLFQILFFVQKMFWNTAGMMRAISKQTNGKLIITINVMNAIFTTLAVIVIIAVSIFFGAKKFNIVSRNVTTAIFVTGFLVVFAMLIFSTVMAVTSGILVIRSIKATTKKVMESRRELTAKAQIELLTKSSNSNNNENTSRQSMEYNVFEKRVTSPFKITFGLLIGLCLCVLMQLVSIAVASTAAILENFKVIWHFFNCLGVLVFAVLVLFLFYPLFLDSEKALQELEKRKNSFHVLEKKDLSKIRLESEEVLCSTPSSDITTE